MKYFFLRRFNFEDETPTTNFDTFPAAILTVFQVRPALPTAAPLRLKHTRPFRLLTERERFLSVFLIRENDSSACLLPPRGFADNPSISRRSSPRRLQTNLTFFFFFFSRGRAVFLSAAPPSFRPPLRLTGLSSSDPDRRGLERRHVPRHRVPGRRSPRHVLLRLLHRPHALRKLYPR